MKFVSKVMLLSVPMMLAFPHLAHARRGIPIFVPTSGPFFYILLAVGVIAILFKAFSALSAGSANAAQFVAQKAPKVAGNFSGENNSSTDDMARMDQLIAARARELQSGHASATSFGQPAASFGKRAGR